MKKITPLYHGSGLKFEKFEPKFGDHNHILDYLGFHFTPDKEMAERLFCKPPNFVLYTVELSVNKTLKISESQLVKDILTWGYENNIYDTEKVDLKRLLKLPYDTDSICITSSLWSDNDRIINKKVLSFKYKEYLINQGYDSIEYLNEIEWKDKNRYDWIVFDSNQIKIINIYEQPPKSSKGLKYDDELGYKNEKKHMKDYKEFLNEGKNVLKSGLPKQAIDELRNLYCKSDFSDVKNIEVFEDPQVRGTLAVRLTRDENGEDYTFDLLWYGGGFDEVEFETWPPTSGEPKFFV